MGLLLSILVGCVGVIELLASLKQVTNEVSNTSTGPTTPCLSYHGPTTESPSFHDSLCNISHSGDIPVPGSARRKLENLHEYSLRVRSELKSLGGSDWSTLSDCSTRDLLSPSRTDSRLSLNFDLMVGDQEDPWDNRISGLLKDETTKISIEVTQPAGSDNKVVIEDTTEPEVAGLTMKSAQGTNDYVRIPTPIPIGLAQEISRSNSSLSSSFENESGNEVPTRMSFEQSPVVISHYSNEDYSSSPQSSIDEEDDISSRIRKRGFKRISRSRSPDVPKRNELESHQEHVVIKSTPKFLTDEVNMGYEVSMRDSGTGPDDPRSTRVVEEASPGKHVESAQKRIKSSKTTTTVLRKATRLKSKNAEISKSAENLTGSTKRTKRQREPERRRSDISVQTMKRDDWLRDEWTNTSPTDSEISLCASRTSVSVEVQTSFDDQPPLTSEADDSKSMMSFEIPVIGLSESRRDVGIKDRDHFGRKAFKNRRFPNSIATKSRSLDDYTNSNWAPGDIDFRGFNDTTTDNRKRFDAKKQQFESNDRGSNGWRSSVKEERSELMRSTEEDSVDEEFVDAEEASTSVSGGGPIEYCIPSTDETDKPFWVNSRPPMKCRLSMSPFFTRHETRFYP